MNEPSFVPLLTVLNEHQVEYFIVGALAAALQGAPVVTFDVDIVHRRSQENIERLLGALTALDACSRADPRKLRPNETHLATGGHQLLQTRLGDLDVLGTIMEASGYDDLIDHTVLVDLEGLRVRVLELSKVIEAKEYAGRPKDLAALPSLRATLNELRRQKP